MPTDQNPKQLVAQRIKDATNILVTVSHDPSVDELSAALALTLILDKIGKTPTAVFSGQIPAAIEFLEPGKTFDTNVDGLRDFIIALDKSKADRLRYKVEDDVVRVFITPYKTTITEKDLTFSQGDFNVDLVVAFGVEKREDLDAAITAHGRILHDAAVVTVNLLPGSSSLGEVDWNDPLASSLCEMLMSLTESLQSGLLDEPIATAILTGLVSATDRFRNEKTSPKVMTMAAQLMAAGANQQLIAEKLEEAATVSTGPLNEPLSQIPSQPAVSDDGVMKVDHEEPTEDAVEEKAQEVAAAESAEAIEEANEQLAEVHEEELPPVQSEESQLSRAKASSWRDAEMPLTGGTLNATSEQAEEDKRREEEADKNHVILSHDSPVMSESPMATPAVLNATTLENSEPSVQDIFATPTSSPFMPTAQVEPTSLPVEQPIIPAPIPEPSFAVPTTQPVNSPFGGAGGLTFEETPVFGAPASQAPVNQTLADLEQEVNRQTEQAMPAQPVPENQLETARAAVDAALGAQPFNPAGQPLAATGAQPLGDISHTDITPPVEPAPQPVAQPQGLPPLPPLPDFSTLPPLPGEQPTVSAQPEPSSPIQSPSFGLPEDPSEAPAGLPTFVPSSDPGQFKLPGQ